MYNLFFPNSQLLPFLWHLENGAKEEVMNATFQLLLFSKANEDTYNGFFWNLTFGWQVDQNMVMELF